MFQGLSVLHIAALYGHLECMKLLLDAGDVVDVNAGCRHGRRPIHMVLTAQSRPDTHTCLTYLLEHGAQTNVYERTALMTHEVVDVLWTSSC